MSKLVMSMLLPMVPLQQRVSQINFTKAWLTVFPFSPLWGKHGHANLTGSTILDHHYLSRHRRHPVLPWNSLISLVIFQDLPTADTNSTGIFAKYCRFKLSNSSRKVFHLDVLRVVALKSAIALLPTPLKCISKAASSLEMSINQPHVTWAGDPRWWSKLTI